MRILLLTQLLVYPADCGPKIKTLQVLKHLAARHDVYYCTFTRSKQEVKEAEKLQEICRGVSTVPMQRTRASDARFLLESMVTGDSFVLRRDYREEMQTRVRQVLREEHIDVLHVDQLNMMRFVPPNWEGAVILDAHNAVWQVVERLQKRAGNPLTRQLLGREVHIIRKLEGAACRRVHLVLAVSREDQQALREVAGNAAPIEIVPITVDAGQFEHTWMMRDPQPDKLFTIGAMFWPPNSEGVSWWLREGYERLQSLLPSVTYDIVGARTPQSLRTLAKNYQGVHMHGYVADTEQFWRQAGALAVPILSGAGVRVKILEAMARSVPVVSTTIGCEGLAVRNEEHLLIADTPGAFALACARVLQDKELAQRLTHNARQLILDRYDAKVSLSILDNAYEKACRQKSTHETITL